MTLSLEALTLRILQARTEYDLAFIAEQCKTAKDSDKEPLRKLWLAKRDHIRAAAPSAAKEGA